jgi:hypothetical protein
MSLISREFPRATLQYMMETVSAVDVKYADAICYGYQIVIEVAHLRVC